MITDQIIYNNQEVYNMTYIHLVKLSEYSNIKNQALSPKESGQK